MKSLLICLFSILASLSVSSQEIVLNLQSYPKTVEVNQNVDIAIMLINNDPDPNRYAPIYKLSPTLKIDPTYLEYVGLKDFPVGWTLCINNIDSLRFSNGTSILENGDYVMFYVTFRAKAPIRSTIIGSYLTFGDGVNDCTVGVQTIGNNHASDYSQTGLEVIQSLPIRLIEFNAINIDCNNHLYWKEEEKHANSYTIQQSADGSEFMDCLVEIFKKNENGLIVSSAQLEPIYSTTFYRLKTINSNGEVEYSKVVQVANACSIKPNVLLKPNPATDYVYISGGSIGDKYMIFDAAGRLLKTEVLNSVTDYQVDIRDYSNGVYYFKLKKITGDEFHLGLIKQ